MKQKIPDTLDEAAWRKQYEELGYENVQSKLNNDQFYNDPLKKFTVRWLQEKKSKQEKLASEQRWIAWTVLIVTVCSLVVGIISLLKDWSQPH